MKKEHTRLLLFLLLSFTALGVVLALTVTDETFTAVRAMSISSILLMVLVWCIDYIADSAALWSLAEASAKGRVSFRRALMLTGLRTFFNTTTPFYSGGAPAVVYSLRKDGLSYGEGTSVSIVKILSITFWYFLFSACSAFIMIIQALHTGTYVYIGIGIIVLAAGGVYVLLFLSCISPKPLIVMVHLAARVGRRFLKFSSHRLERRMLHEAYIVRTCTKSFFLRNRGLFLLNMFFSFLTASAQVYLLVLIFQSLGLGRELFLDMLIRSSVLLFLIRFMPTPGGAGFGEGLYVVLFSGIAPLHLLGVAVLIWRLFLNISKAGIGAVVFSYTSSH